MKSVLKKCREKLESLTEPNPPIKQPSEEDQYRGFQLIRLTDDGAPPSFGVIRDRATLQLWDNVFCHTSPDSYVHDVSSGCH